MTDTQTGSVTLEEGRWQCRSDDHDYQQLGRAVSKQSGTEENRTMTYEPIRLFCRKCGWVRDIRD